MMNLNWRIPLILMLIWLTVSLGAILPTATIEVAKPVSSSPPPVVVPPPSPSQSGNYIFYFLQAALFVIVVVGIVGAFVYRRHAAREALATAIAFMLYMGVLGLVYLLVHQVSIVVHSGSGEAPTAPGTSPAYSSNTLILTLISILLAVGFSVFLLKVYGKKKVEEEKPRVEARERVERAIYKARIGKDVRGAILSAYKEMEMLMRERGVRDQEYFTPREFREFALENLKISQEPVDILTELFEIARYSRHEMTEDDRDRAIKALEAIRNEIG